MSEHGQHEQPTAKSADERRDSIPDTSDKEIDTFEDANDSTQVEEAQVASPIGSTRSLTNRTSSTQGNTQDTQAPTLATPPVPSMPGALISDTEVNVLPEVEPEASPPKSPLLTSHRISAATLDNVSLDGEGATESSSLPPPVIPALPKRQSLDAVEPEPEKAPPTPPPKAAKAQLTGLSGKLPSVPWSPPPPPPPAPAPAPVASLPPPAPPTRKLTSPFSWLSRNSSSTPKETVMSPPLVSPNNERRNTASSILTIGSNPEMMLSKLEEGDEEIRGRPGRGSLKDRFKLLRMREEAGITTIGEEGQQEFKLGRRSASVGGLASPSTTFDDREPPLSPLPRSPNPALAPGTAAGVTAGPSAMTDPSAPVDWDLWQSVVYEGPAAVARTSAEELNRAIATGIPNAIRGVVWQVLAQSKNEELEVVYRELLARGTDKEKDRMSASSAALSNGSSKDKDTIQSSASSVHSDQSTAATTLTNGPRSPSPPSEKDVELSAKALAAVKAERKRKAKEDAASLQKLEKAIKRDLGARTSFSKFAASAGLQDGLFGVCKSYALFDEGVGYAQGMNFLAMPLLFNMPEEEAFCLLVRLMNQYHLRDLFIADMPGLHKHLYLFERLLEDFEPALYCHLHRRQVSPHLYATQWFLTLFAYRFPLQLVLRIYDLILSEGLSAILRFGLVLMQKNAATLLAMNDMAALTTFLKDRLFDVYIDASPSAGSILESGFFGSSGASIDKEVYRADHLVQDACAVKVTPELLKAYTAEWEEKTSIEKAREAELDRLKTTTASLSLKVRKLEERVEMHDTDHAALATDLVKTKVENEELRDENESLKVEVEELKKVVDQQPGEVEERLKSEMDRMMKRNLEVHEENGKLEEEMAQMEKTLVETKMAHAEVSAQYEAINRKWTDLRKALD